jgi:hypothetical protein
MNGWRYFSIGILAFGCESNILIQIEFENRFRRNHYFLAFGEHLGPRTARGANGGSDGCALSVSNERTNDCAYYGSAPDHLSRARVRAKSTPAFLIQVCGGDVIAPPIDGDRLNVQRDLGAARNTTCRYGSNDKLSRGTPGDNQFVRTVYNVLVHLSGKELI